MIAFFPKIYPDELIYSQLARYHVRSGYARYVFTAQDLFKNDRLTVPSIEFVNQYTADCRSWLTKYENWEYIVRQHTMANAYIRFLPKQRRIAAMNGLMTGEGIIQNLLCIPNSGNGKVKRYLRYCPECAREDRAKYGETFWHREHQVQRVRVCSKHQCYLVESDVVIGGKATTGLHDAESHIPIDGEIKVCEETKELDFSRYVIDVMNAPLDLESPLPIGRFLHSKLGREYLNDSGLMRNTTKLYQDYIDFFDGMPVMSATYVEKIFNGYHFDVYFILQIAFFLGLSVEEITKLPIDVPIYGLNALYEKLARKFEVDVSMVDAIGKTVMNYYNNQTRVQRKSGVRPRAYDELDAKYLPLVKKEVKKIKVGFDRPRKLSFAMIERTLNLPQKQIYKLPKCAKHIEQHLETQGEYWAREVVWAIAVIRKEGRALNCKQIRLLTNMRMRDLEYCCEYIKEEEVKEVLRGLLGLPDGG